MRYPALLPFLLIVLSFPPRAFAVNCNSPPTGYSGSYAREYQAWCQACCGTFSMSGGNPTCNPGTNWGCKGQQGSTGALPGIYNGYYQLGYQLGQSIGKAIFGDPQEEARKQAQALQQNRQMMQSLDQMGREQARDEDERRLNAMREARLLDERNREDTLSSLKGIPRQETLSGLQGIPQGDGELVLKPGTDFFSVPGNPASSPPPPPDSSVVDLRHLDPDAPIVVDNSALRDVPMESRKEKEPLSPAECEKRMAVRDRLAGGLPVQEEAIRRTRAQLESAEKGIAEASSEKRQVLLDGALQEIKGYATDLVTSAEALRAQVEMLKDLDKGKRDLLIRSFHTLLEEGETLQQAARAGYGTGEEIRTKMDRISGVILPQAYKLLIESGIAEKAGEELSEKLAGPLGALGFRGAKLTIDFAVAAGKGKIGEAEREAARRNLDAMGIQLERSRKRIAELERELADGCRATRQARP